MKLIINADDFGRTRGINYGVVEAMKNGVLSSTTIMMNMPYAEHAVNLAKKEGITSIGVHLTFIEKSLSLGKTLVDKDGVFKKYPELMKEADIEEIKTEMRVQIDKLINMGIKPTHLDGHHHVHLYSLKMTEAVFAIAKEYNLPVRVGRTGRTTKLGEELVIPLFLKTIDLFEDRYYADKVGVEDFKAVVENVMMYDVVELMCHPAFLCTDTLKSSYNYPRLTELDVITSDEIKEFIVSKGIEIVDYSVL
ncbi:MAG: carbohydrate deacetylase [Fusobacteriales bacterium]|nr:carbohydrate deacetylase [Fusobacteriales bacterium]